VDHNERLFKGYVLGDFTLVAERRSLPNLALESSETVEFNTQQPYPTATDFALSTDAIKNTPTGVALNRGNNSLDTGIEQRVKAIGNLIQEETGLSLFGFDVIIDQSESDWKFLVIDVNYFPSYKELPDFDERIRKHIHHLVKLHNGSKNEM